MYLINSSYNELLSDNNLSLTVVFRKLVQNINFGTVFRKIIYLYRKQKTLFDLFVIEWKYFKFDGFTNKNKLWECLGKFGFENSFNDESQLVKPTNVFSSDNLAY